MGWGCVYAGRQNPAVDDDESHRSFPPSSPLSLSLHVLWEKISDGNGGCVRGLRPHAPGDLAGRHLAGAAMPPSCRRQHPDHGGGEAPGGRWNGTRRRRLPISISTTNCAPPVGPPHTHPHTHTPTQPPPHATPAARPRCSATGRRWWTDWGHWAATRPRTCRCVCVCLRVCLACACVSECVCVCV